MKISYAATADEITIEGTSYAFADGRVFLVAASSSPPAITQLKLPFSGGGYLAEIKRLETQPDVKKFREVAGAAP